MSIQAITFDFWMTLFRDADGERRIAKRVAACVELLKVSENDADRALKAAQQQFMRVHLEEQRTLTPEDAADIAANHLGVALTPEIRHELGHRFGTAILDHSPVPIDGALEAVRAAADLGPVAVISDTGISPGASLRQLLDRHGFTEHFTCLTFSDEVGLAKPQRPMFDKTAAALGVPANAMFHLGDLEPTDVAGILAVGGRAGLFAGANARFLGATKAHHTFTHWREFLPVLAEVA